MTEDVVWQPSYRNCYVCGKENPIGLNVRFYQQGTRVFTRFTPGPEHQGYPDRMHGGIASALLDETIGRAGFIYGYWTFTAKFEVKYRKPVPLGREITIAGEVTRDRGRSIEATGQILLDDGTVAVEGNGLFIKLKPDEVETLEHEIGHMECSPPATTALAVSVRGIIVDLARREILLDGEPVAVTPAEYRLLACLAGQLGRVVPSSELLKEMSGYSCPEQEAQEIVKVHVSRLRGKLDNDPSKASYLLNVRGFGYLLERRTTPDRPLA